MKVLIIEDELLAQAKLEAMLLALDPATEIMGKLGSVKDAIKWLAGNPAPDAAFVDIQLSDDHSFEIFREIKVDFPVIFTTAYDKYLLQSFEVNAIDYLLKPISEDKLKRSLEKLRTLERHFLQGSIQKLVTNAPTQSTNRIVVKKGIEFIALDLEQVAYFYTEHRIVFAKDFAGKQFIADKNLTELDASLNRADFFRINRKFIANIRSIEKFKPDNGKIRVFLKPPMNDEVHVSKETAPEFRKWIGADYP